MSPPTAAGKQGVSPWAWQPATMPLYLAFRFSACTPTHISRSNWLQKVRRIQNGSLYRKKCVCGSAASACSSAAASCKGAEAIDRLSASYLLSAVTRNSSAHFISMVSKADIAARTGSMHAHWTLFCTEAALLHVLRVHAENHFLAECCHTKLAGECVPVCVCRAWLKWAHLRCFAACQPRSGGSWQCHRGT